MVTAADRLPDPRSNSGIPGLLARLTGQEPADVLVTELRAALAAGDDAAIVSALHGNPPALARRIWRELSIAIDAGDDGVGMRLFALPVVIVAGARKSAMLPGAVPAIDRVVSLLEQHGAVGVTRNFGLGNALCSAATLEALSPTAIWRATHDPAERSVADGLPPEPIAVGSGREQVHLRFLVGAGVTPQNLPSFLESAANIGTWGMPLTRELARQLAVPGVEILPMPRPPQPLAKAAYVGRCAQLEAALSLFLGSAVRDFRMSVGDPRAVVSSHELTGGAGELRLSLSSPFDDSLLEGFCWPLHPLDDCREVADILGRALIDCRVSDVIAIERVLPAVLEHGHRFVTSSAADRYMKDTAEN